MLQQPSAMLRIWMGRLADKLSCNVGAQACSEGDDAGCSEATEIMM